MLRKLRCAPTGGDSRRVQHLPSRAAFGCDSAEEMFLYKSQQHNSFIRCHPPTDDCLNM